ncbi:AraC family transcriptional regulator [Ferruginibacter paludis]|uniref:helix-turn-helix domain-containing protein n=1 Tax=Ferruginibacter paludis TaxID=1310417 RepID=UPI0025B53FD9|nr:AraC family transcriptional regulator [Ferruginibacter paludis]MDN3657207.1 AraC family transcriptional regulator [Ferruginibacter paludis]
MILKEFLPDAALREFVQCYRIVHFQFDKFTQIPFKVYPPKPEECLYFILQDSLKVELSNFTVKEIQLPVIIGQQTTINRRYFQRNFLNVQVVFQPTGLYRLTGVPAFELTNQLVHADYILPKSVRFIQEQLQHAKSYSEMLLIINNYVADLVRNKQKDFHLLDSVSNSMMHKRDHVTLDWLAKESCLSTKQFKRKFHERTGVNPKTYARIIRFTKAFNTKNAFPAFDWLRIAIGCGYFDYQHLVKDYKDFTGFTPNEFHLLENNSPESMLGLTGELYRSRVQ